MSNLKFRKVLIETIYVYRWMGDTYKILHLTDIIATGYIFSQG